MKSIILDSWEVLAALEGRGSQLRRPVPDRVLINQVREAHPAFRHDLVTACPYATPGEKRWVKETWRQWDGPPSSVIYRADELDLFPETSRWRPSVHMPQDFSRLTLELDVRVQQLGEMTEDDCDAQGLFNASGLHLWHCGYQVFHPDQPCGCGDKEPEEEFADLWNSKYSKRGYPWHPDLWVWVLDYKVVPQEETR